MKIISLILFLFPVFSLADSTLIYEAKRKGIELKDDDEKILSIGEISTARYFTGGVVGTYPTLGFGLGHAIQGRWSDDGWIFTVGELGTLSLLVAGASGCADSLLKTQNCSNLENNMIVTGLIGFLGFRIWEIIDLWFRPPSYNKKYKTLKKYIESAPSPKDTSSSIDLSPLFHPRHGGSGIMLTFRF